MARSARELFEEAMRLDPEERATLMRLLIESLDAESEVGVEDAWRVEIERRMAELDSGSVETIPWEELGGRRLMGTADRMDRVVPVAVEPMGREAESGELLIGDGAPFRVRAAISSHRTRRPVAVRVAPIRLTITARLASGWPRQLRRCTRRADARSCSTCWSPAGKWQVVIVRLVRVASCCSSHFHSRSRAPLLPPASAVISSERARR